MSLIRDPDILKQIYDTTLKNQITVDYLKNDIRELNKNIEKKCEEFDMRIDALERYKSYIKGFMVINVATLTVLLSVILK